MSSSGRTSASTVVGTGDTTTTSLLIFVTPYVLSIDMRQVPKVTSFVEIHDTRLLHFYHENILEANESVYSPR